MLKGFNVHDIDSYNVRILDPSAGKGDILEYIQNNNNKRLSLFCIEKEPELQMILRSKNYKFLDDDFLEFQPDSSFDLIIMNPPFDNGVKHFLKAWDIGSDTEIRCLLNAETINNPYSKERKLLLDIIEKNNGTIENLGNCFSTAVRKTNTEVVLIKIFKKQKDEYKFDFEKHFDQEKQFTIDDLNRNQVANIDVFGDLELRYNKVRELFKKMLEVKNEIMFYGNDVIPRDIFELFDKNYLYSDLEQYNNICDNIRKHAWNNIFNKTKIDSVTTKTVKKKIRDIQEQQGYMSFTTKNMENLFNDLFQNFDNIMNDCVIEAFDLLTKYHEENRCHIEGWKTNKRFYVNKKFILPYVVDTTWFGINDIIHLYYGRQEELLDIEKALCYLTGKKIGDCSSIYEMFSQKKIDTFGKWYDSEFFEFKCFKKGTMHFKFKDDKLWEKFNVEACKGKNWLGFDLNK